MLCLRRSYDKCKNIRFYGKIALQEKDVNNRCHGNDLKASSIAESIADVRKYDEIPGPRGIFGVGTFYHYFPVVGM